jgi:hypothetical protein
MFTPSALSAAFKRRLTLILRVFLLSLSFGFITISLIVMVPSIGMGMTSALEFWWPDASPIDISEFAALCAIPCIIIESVLRFYEKVIRPLRA